MSMNRFFYAVNYTELENCLKNGDKLNRFLQENNKGCAFVSYGYFIGKLNDLINANDKIASLSYDNFRFIEANIMAMNVGYYHSYLTQDIYSELCECDFEQTIITEFGEEWQNKDELEGMLEDIRHLFKVASENNLIVVSFDA